MWSILIAGFAWAEDAPSPPEVYEVRAPRDERHPGAALTVVDLDERRGEQTSAAELLDELPGLQIRSTGGLGAYSAVSVRGSSASQTAVYLDGVPLNRGAFGPVDLGAFAVEGLDRIEVWRGLPPPDRMGAGLGGVIDLITRRDPGGEARATGGSFGTRGVAARAGGRSGDTFLAGTASYLGSEGDFTYLDHNGTLSNPSDDEWRERRNNGFDQADLVLHGDHDGWIWARATQNVFYKTQGIPGPLTTSTTDPGLDTIRSVSRLDLGRPGRLTAATYLAFQGDRYRDPNNEIGLGAQDQRSRTWAGGGEVRATFASGPTALVLVPQVHHERYDQDDALAPPGAVDPDARRLVLGGAVFDVVTLWGGRLVVEPAVRIDRYDDKAVESERTDVLVSPRAGGRLTAARDVDLRASVGRYHRAPTFLEAFGDRGFLVGNPDLRAERGIAADAGVLWRGPVRVDAGVHGAWVDDLILLAQNSQQTVRAQNVGHARLLGVETAISARPLRRVHVQVSYAYLAATNLDDGRRLPGRARHEAYGRIDAGPQTAGPLLLRAYADVDATAGMVLDAANLRPVPRRAFVGAGVVLQPRSAREWSLTVEGKNLTNERAETVELLPSDRSVTVAIQDYLGYALPGRAFYATARRTF